MGGEWAKLGGYRPQGAPTKSEADPDPIETWEAVKAANPDLQSMNTFVPRERAPGKRMAALALQQGSDITEVQRGRALLASPVFDEIDNVLASSVIRLTN